MSLSFSCDRKELFNSLKFIRSVQKSKSRKYLMSLTLEMTLEKDYITLICVGASNHLPCEREEEKRALVTMPFEYFFQNIKTFSKDIVKLTIDNGSIDFGTYKWKSYEIKIKKPVKGKTEIKLPLNHTDKDVLKLSLTNSEEELGRNGLLGLATLAKMKLERNLMNAHMLLGEYGVSKKELRDFVEVMIKK